MNHPLRSRALFIGLIAGVVICAATPYVNSYLRATPLAGGHFPLAAFLVYFVALVLLAAVARISRRAPLLSGMELLTAWALMVVVSGIGFTGLVRTFFINITAPAQFADAGNGWADSLLPLLPPRLYPRDPAFLESLYNGLAGKADLDFAGTMAQIPWSFWLPVLAQWAVFILLVYAALFCLANLFAGQWLVNERINFPLLQTPRLLAEAYDENRLFAFLRDPYLLSGLSLPLLMHTFGGMSAHIPSVPALSPEILVGSYFPADGMLSGFQKLKIYLYPAFIGFAFITTRQVSLSFWVFFLLTGLLTGILQTSGLQIPDTALGTLFGTSIVRPEEIQVVGASLVFFLFMIWLARDYLSDVIRQCLGRATGHEEVGWISARASLIGLIVSLVALCLWSMACGMSLLASVLLYISFFAAALIAAKVVCQGGVPYSAMNVAPADGVLSTMGSKPLGGIGLVLGMSLQKMLFVDVRESLLPSLLNAGKVTERMQGRGRVALAVAAALVAAVAASFVAMLYLAYRHGLQDLDMDWATRTTMSVYEGSQRLLESPSTPDPSILVFIAVGAAVMLLLVLCYYFLPWWPLHPLGYLMAYSGSMKILWFSFLVGWACNALCLRYGGTFLFRRLRLVFIGLIIGDFAMGAFWAVVSLFTGVSYLVLPA
ncbi:MAG: hypothetical protein F9K32_20035 [Desulfobulbaceae bacterium]|nr:MAG: hypothetical protein F9K32_20035 [Desulfobulbaceae bacterium]